MEDLATEGFYLINMKLKVCLDPDTDNVPCEKTVSLFSNYKLPKRSCNWNTQIQNGAGISRTHTSICLIALCEDSLLVIDIFNILHLNSNIGHSRKCTSIGH